jgi:hypothetical protein
MNRRKRQAQLRVTAVGLLRASYFDFDQVLPAFVEAVRADSNCCSARQAIISNAASNQSSKKGQTMKTKMPELPAANATEAEREAYRRAMHRWCNKHRGVELNAKGLEQERQLIELLSKSPEELRHLQTAATERVRNLLGGDFTNNWDPLPLI